MPIDINNIIGADKESGEKDHSPISPYKRFVDNTAYARQIGSSPLSFSIDKDLYDKYIKYNVPLGNNINYDDIQAQLANNQSRFEKLANSSMQMLVNEIVYGTLLGFTNGYDAVANLFNKEENDFSSEASKILIEAQDKLRETYDIFRRNPDKAFDVLDLGWWAEQQVNIASSLSLLLPAAGETKAISLIGKGLKLDKLSYNVLNSISKAGQRASKTNKLLFRPRVWENEIESFLSTGTTAFLSRTAENYQEAQETKKAVYSSALSALNNYSDEEKDNFFKRNPDMIGKSNEDIANHISNLAAGNTMRQDYWMLLMDFLEYKSLDDIVKKGFRGNSSAVNRIQTRNLRRQLAEGENAALESEGFLARGKEAIVHAAKNPKELLSSIPFNESIEEGFQGITQEKSKEYSNLYINPNTTLKPLTEYLIDPHILEQAFWGVLGGAIFQASGKGFHTLKDNALISIQNHRNKKITDGFQADILSESKRRNVEIAGRKDRIDTFIDRINDINNGNSRVSNLKDDPRDFENDKRKKLTNDEEIAAQRMRAVNDFVSGMVMDAIDNNTIDTLSELVNSNEFNSYIDREVKSNADSKLLNEHLKDMFNETEELYSNALNSIYNNIKNPNMYAVRQAARVYTQNELEKINKQRDIDYLNDKISITSDAKNKNINANYESLIKLNSAKTYLEDINKREKDLNTLYENNAISIDALNAYKKDFDKERFTVLGIIDTISNDIESAKEYNDRIKEYFKKTKRNFKNTSSEENYKEFSSLINEFEKSVDSLIKDSANGLKNVQLLTETEDLLKRRNKAEIELAVLEQKRPKDIYDFQEFYDETTHSLDAYINKKYNDAKNKVLNYLKNSEDLDNAFDNIIHNKNLNESLSEAASILKIGYGTTKIFWDEITKTKNYLEKERAKEKINAESIINPDGTQEHNPEAAQELNNEGEQAIENIIPDIIDSNEIDENDIFVPFTGEDEMDFFDITQPGLLESYDVIDSKLGIYWNNNKNIMFNHLSKVEKISLDDENYKALHDLLYNEFAKYGKTPNESEQLVQENIKHYLQFINNNDAQLDKRKILARLITQIGDRAKIDKNNDGTYSLTTAIVNEDGSIPVEDAQTFISMIEELFKEYVKQIHIPKINGKHIINIDRLIEYILTSDVVNQTEAFKAINSIYKYIRDENVLKELRNHKSIFKLKGTRNITNFHKNPLGLLEVIKKNKRDQERLSSFMHNRLSKEFNELSDTDKSNLIKDIYSGKKVLIPIRYENIIVTVAANKNDEKDIRRWEKILYDTRMITDFQDKESLINYKKVHSRFESNLKSLNAIELSMIGAVDSDSFNNNTLYLRHVDNGIKYQVWEENNELGTSIVTNLDDLFYSLINIAEDESFIDNEFTEKDIDDLYKEPSIDKVNNLDKTEATKLLFYVLASRNENYRNKNFVLLSAAEQNKATEIFSENIINLFNKVYEDSILDVIESNDVDSISTKNVDIANMLIKQISNVLFFKNNGEDSSYDSISMSLYYSQWKSRMYTNYTDTIKLENNMELNDVEISLKQIGNESPNYVEDDIPISNNNFNKENNPIVGVIDNNGNIVVENNNYTMTNPYLKGGTLGVLIKDINGVPIIAPFTTSNRIFGEGVKNEIGKLVKDEVTNIISDFYKINLIEEESAKNIKQRELVNKLINLFGDVQGNISPLGYGIEVLATEKNIKLIVKDSITKENKVLMMLGRYNNLNFISTPAIDEKGNILKNDKGNTLYRKLGIEDAVNLISQHLRFNKSMFALKNKNNAENTSNPYFQKVINKDNKTVYNVLGLEYDSYFDFVIKNNAFNTNVAFDTNTDSYFVRDNANSAYIDVSSVTHRSVYEKFITNEKTDIIPALELIKSSGKKGVTKDAVLNEFGLPDVIKDVMSEILPDRIYYHTFSVKEEKELKKPWHGKTYKDGNELKVAISNRGVEQVIKEGSLLRLLGHEGLHYKLSDKNVFEREEFINDLMDIYNEFIEVLQEEVKNNDKNAIKINNWIENNKFKPNNIFIEDDVNNRKFAEEWLVESLTRPELMNFLNTHKAKNAKNINDNLSLLQKILNKILEIFNPLIKLQGIEKNSILEKQIAIFNEQSSDNLNDSPSNFDTNEKGETIISGKEQEISSDAEKGNDSDIEEEEEDNGPFEASDDDDDLSEGYDDAEPEYIVREKKFKASGGLKSSTTSIYDSKEEYENNIMKDIVKTHKSNINGFGLINSAIEFTKRYPADIQPLIADELAKNSFDIICML